MALRPSVLLLVLALAACGGSAKPAWEQAAQCLRPLGTYIDHGRPLSLPFRNPFAQTGLMASPRVFERDLELSYPPQGKGANAVELYFFKAEEDAKRVLRRARETPSFNAGWVVETIGPAIVRWSSKPARSQRSAVVGCIAG